RPTASRRRWATTPKTGRLPERATIPPGADAGGSPRRLSSDAVRARVAHARLLRLAVGMRHAAHTALAQALDPLADAQRIAHARRALRGVEQHDDDRPRADARLHHDAVARLGDEAGLLQPDLPVVAVDQAVRVAVVLDAVADVDRQRARGRVLTDQRIARGRLHEQREVAGAGDVAARQPGRLHEARAGHAELERLAVHLRDERGHAARVV